METGGRSMSVAGGDVGEKLFWIKMVEISTATFQEPTARLQNGYGLRPTKQRRRYAEVLKGREKDTWKCGLLFLVKILWCISCASESSLSVRHMCCSRKETGVLRVRGDGSQSKTVSIQGRRSNFRLRKKWRDFSMTWITFIDKQVYPCYLGKQRMRLSTFWLLIIFTQGVQTKATLAKLAAGIYQDPKRVSSKKQDSLSVFLLFNKPVQRVGKQSNKMWEFVCQLSIQRKTGVEIHPKTWNI